MLCDWCDERIVEETGEYKSVWRAQWEKPTPEAVKPVIARWNESFYHDYCFEDGTRGEDVRENEQGELEIR